MNPSTKVWDLWFINRIRRVNQCVWWRRKCDGTGPSFPEQTATTRPEPHGSGLGWIRNVGGKFFLINVWREPSSSVKKHFLCFTFNKFSCFHIILFIKSSSGFNALSTLQKNLALIEFSGREPLLIDECWGLRKKSKGFLNEEDSAPICNVSFRVKMKKMFRLLWNEWASEQVKTGLAVRGRTCKSGTARIGLPRRRSARRGCQRGLSRTLSLCRDTDEEEKQKQKFRKYLVSNIYVQNVQNSTVISHYNL